jgi:hypothetical protein
MADPFKPSSDVRVEALSDRELFAISRGGSRELLDEPSFTRICHHRHYDHQRKRWLRKCSRERPAYDLLRLRYAVALMGGGNADATTTKPEAERHRYRDAGKWLPRR